MFNSPTFWLLLGIALLLSEFLIPGFTIFFFGIGALITSLILIVIPPVSNLPWLQFLIFFTTSVISLIFLRRHFKKTLTGDLYKEKEDYIGEECIVIERVTPTKPGRIKFQGTTWSAYSTEGNINKNQKASIVSKKTGDPMVYIIKK